ncbi:hypothetical protein TRFO_23138 [Tritrichomonas foetus]|uniref:DNA2/NAM7 helicase-like C-terminal domain-containing protein n=1 Tax=Tritrichomonas foetus TaxID=1144522 RepID=A0A1J4KAY3_9EUKA|nr:hypothetical protein TRFO_23138 [Tritrichomonas foetus]|eukprot:OHT08379.1 hypothetical protein TRFO_23138 [Tritrichomonas foetus]
MNFIELPLSVKVNYSESNRKPKHMDPEIIFKLTYSKDVNKKKGKKWLDGIGSFIPFQGTSRFRFILKDEEGKICDDTSFNGSKGLPEMCEEIRIGKHIIVLDEKISSDSIIIENESSNFNSKNQVLMSDEITASVNSSNSTSNQNIRENLSNCNTSNFKRPIRRTGISRNGVRPNSSYSRPSQLILSTDHNNNANTNLNNNDNYSSSNHIINNATKRITVTPKIPDNVSSSPEKNNKSTSSEISNHNSNFGSTNTNNPLRQIRKKPRTLDEIFTFFGAIDENREDSSSMLNNSNHQPQNEINISANENVSKINRDHPILVFSQASEPTTQDSIEETTNTLDHISSQSNNLENNRVENPTNNQPKKTFDCSINLIWESNKRMNNPPSIQERFSSIEEYKSAFIKGIIYEMNAKIYDVYKVYKAGLFMVSSKPPFCPTHKVKMIFLINNKNFMYFYKCPHNNCKYTVNVPPDADSPPMKGLNINEKASLSSFLSKKGIAYHESTIFRNKGQTMLTFNSEKLENVEYSKDDVWVCFSDSIRPFFICSESYGVYSNKKVEIGGFFNNTLASLPQQIRVSAIRIFNAQTERQALSNLLYIDEANFNEYLPIIPTLLQGDLSSFSFPMKDDNEIDVDRMAHDICEKYSLNEDQTNALCKVADFFKTEKPPMLLVHGLFGAGKSKLLSVIAIYLTEVLNAINSPDKILIAASTNVAVDNILSNLYYFEFLDFTRVGSVKKIRRSLLPFVTGHGTEESISELSSIIKETAINNSFTRLSKSNGRNVEQENNRQEIQIIQEALKNAEDEMHKKVSKIDQCRVVGVTCAACSFAVMQNRKFPFVLLDECSQQTEPISLIPMCFGCQRLVCCGDPKQLPPTLNKEADNGYGRPLFTRMMHMIEPVMLSIQYRCHPSIADICSYSFYDGKVKHGISKESREPLFGMPTMCVFNVKCGQESLRGGSTYNTCEAIVVVNLAKFLINAGVAPEEIGVIAFYKAQVEEISGPLCEGRRHPIVDVSTVDAFQGDEREIIIITTAKTKGSTFIDSPNRVNVAISRAKRHLFLVANLGALMRSNGQWNFVFSKAGNKPNMKIDLSEAPDSTWIPFTSTMSE